MDEKPMEDIKILVPFPKCVSSLTLTANVGTFVFDDITKANHDPEPNHNPNPNPNPSCGDLRFEQYHQG